MKSSYNKSITQWFLPQELKGRYEKIVENEVKTYNIYDLAETDPIRIHIENLIKENKNGIQD